LSTNSPAPPPRVPAVAAVQSSPPVKDNLRRPSFLLFGFTRGSSSLVCCRSSSQSPWEPRLDHTGAPPDPPLLPSSAAIASSSPSSSPATPLNCEQFLPARFPFLSFTAAHPQARRSGRSAPFRCRPPARHNCPYRPPVTCARAPASFCTSSWSEWWPGMPSRANAGEPLSRATALWRRHRRPSLACVLGLWISLGRL
jgi:hypothetical protein